MNVSPSSKHDVQNFLYGPFRWRAFIFTNNDYRTKRTFRTKFWRIVWSFCELLNIMLIFVYWRCRCFDPTAGERFGICEHTCCLARFRRSFILSSAIPLFSLSCSPCFDRVIVSSPTISFSCVLSITVEASHPRTFNAFCFFFPTFAYFTCIYYCNFCVTGSTLLHNYVNLG